MNIRNIVPELFNRHHEIEGRILKKLDYDVESLSFSRRIRVKVELIRIRRKIEKELRGIAGEIYDRKREALIDFAVGKIREILA